MSLSFLKTGAEVHTNIAKAEAQQEARTAQSNAPWRFWMPEGTERRITFLDGFIGDNGLLQTVQWWEHNLNLGGKWGNFFTCTKDEEPCPICEGEDYPALVQGFTVLDHTPYTTKGGPNAGKVIVNSRKFFVCKRDSFKVLSNIAIKRGGLAGCTFDVSRIGDKSANVGSHFDFEVKQTHEQLAKMYQLKPEEVQPFNYKDIIIYRTADDLREQGFGTIQPLGAADKPAMGNLPGLQTNAGLPSADSMAQEL